MATVEARRLEQPEASVEVVPLRSYPLAEAAAHSLGHVGEITDRQLEQPDVRRASSRGPWWGSPASSSSTTASSWARTACAASWSTAAGWRWRRPSASRRWTARRAGHPGPGAAAGLRGGHGAARRAAWWPSSPETGEVLAYLSTPAYDPNAFSLGIEPALWSALNTRPARSRSSTAPIQGTYPPGSTFKIVIALAALQEGVITPEHALPLPGLPGRLQHRLPLPQGGGPRHGGPASRPSRSPATCTSTTWASGWRSSASRATRRCWAWPRPPASTCPHEVSGIFQDPEWKLRVQKAPLVSRRRRCPSPSARPCPSRPMQLARVAAVVANGGQAGAAALHEAPSAGRPRAHAAAQGPRLRART